MNIPKVLKPLETALVWLTTSVVVISCLSCQSEDTYNRNFTSTPSVPTPTPSKILTQESIEEHVRYINALLNMPACELGMLDKYGEKGMEGMKRQIEILCGPKILEPMLLQEDRIRLEQSILKVSKFRGPNGFERLEVDLRNVDEKVISIKNRILITCKKEVGKCVVREIGFPQLKGSKNHNKKDNLEYIEIQRYRENEEPNTYKVVQKLRQLIESIHESIRNESPNTNR